MLILKHLFAYRFSKLFMQIWENITWNDKKVETEKVISNALHLNIIFLVFFYVNFTRKSLYEVNNCFIDFIYLKLRFNLGEQ